MEGIMTEENEGEGKAGASDTIAEITAVIGKAEEARSRLLQKVMKESSKPQGLTP